MQVWFHRYRAGGVVPRTLPRCEHLLSGAVLLVLLATREAGTTHIDTIYVRGCRCSPGETRQPSEWPAVKSIPGHRLGLVVASTELHRALSIVLDSLQICPPRPIQLALAPILGSLRAGIIQTALDVQARRELFQQHLPAGWRIGSLGGCFAFVRHPFPGRGSLEVCQQLAGELGVVLLPAAFFYPEEDQETDRWIRFSIASCDDEKKEA
ncbi:pyridoxal phosphate-dependent transferase [Mycena latifolia]|nr:pyridoxal phosphate-dependent transferase [Mycena latifolia]